jgi:hypothetical protein
MSGLHQQRQADKKAQGLLGGHGQTTARDAEKQQVKTSRRPEKP